MRTIKIRSQSGQKYYTYILCVSYSYPCILQGLISKIHTNFYINNKKQLTKGGKIKLVKDLKTLYEREYLYSNRRMKNSILLLSKESELNHRKQHQNPQNGFSEKRLRKPSACRMWTQGIFPTCSGTPFHKITSKNCMAKPARDKNAHVPLIY